MYPERYKRQLAWLESCSKRGIRVLGQSATLELNFAFTFKDWKQDLGAEYKNLKAQLDWAQAQLDAHARVR